MYLKVILLACQNPSIYESLTLYIIVNEWREEYESAFKAGSMTLYNNANQQLKSLADSFS